MQAHIGPQQLSKGAASSPAARTLAPASHRTRRRATVLETPSGAQCSCFADSLRSHDRAPHRTLTVTAATGRAGTPGFSWSGIKKDLLTPQEQQGPAQLNTNRGQQQQMAADLVTGKQANVVFHLKYKTAFGQSVKLLGGHPKLGAWNLRDAVEMRWTQGDQWVATIPLPAGGVYEYKYVLIDYETKQALEWQHGSNAVLAVVVSESEVNVYDNWTNSPGSKVEVEQESMTRENKLQKWATEMLGYWKEARKLQIELAHKNNESQTLRNDLAQLRMELSLEKQQRVQAEQQIAELRLENAGLRAQLVQKSLELNRTLAEVLQLLDQELDEESAALDEDEEEGEEHEELMMHHEHEQPEPEPEHEPSAWAAAGSNGRGGYRSSSLGVNGSSYGYGGGSATATRVEWSRNGTH